MGGLPELLQKLRAYRGQLQTQLVLRLLMLTGVRTGELRLATPDQFHLDQGFWIIPPEIVKQLQLDMNRDGKQSSDKRLLLMAMALFTLGNAVVSLAVERDLGFECHSYPMSLTSDPSTPLQVAYDIESRTALGHRHYFYRVDIQMLRLLDDPEYSVGDVLRSNSFYIFVQSFDRFHIAIESYHREFSPRTQAGLDIGNSHMGTSQIGAQIQTELFDESLAGSIYITSRIWVGPGDRSNVDDQSAVSLNHPWQNSMSDEGKTGDVSGDHALPILYIALLCTLNAQRQPRIIHQYINGKRGLTHLLERLVEGQRISDIQRQRDELFAKLLPQEQELLHAACSAYDPIAFGNQPMTDCFTKAG